MMGEKPMAGIPNWMEKNKKDFGMGQKKTYHARKPGIRATNENFLLDFAFPERTNVTGP